MTSKHTNGANGANGHPNGHGACPDDPPGYLAGLEVLEAHHPDPDGTARKAGRGPSQADRLIGIAQAC